MSLPDREAAARLAAATRRVIDLVRRSAAAPDVMDGAAAALEEIAERLEPDAYAGPFMQRDLAFEPGFGRIASELEREDWEPPTDFREFFPYSPIVGPCNPIAPPIAFEVDEQKRLRGRVVYGAAYTGPPQSVHGGVIAASFDELLGSANLARGLGGMTGTLTVRYAQPTPIGRPIDLLGWVDRVEGRKVFTRGEMRHEGRLTAEASGIFIGGSMEKLLANAAA